MLELLHLQDHFAERVRKFMSDEIEFDVGRGVLYMSPRLSPTGQARYISLLKDAAAAGNDNSLAYVLRDGGCIAQTEISHRKGKAYTKNVPVNAHETLAEGEFNRFYLRGLCHVASEEHAVIEVYRARSSANPRPESEQLVGREIDPVQLLTDLRNNIGVDTALGLPPGPNSGLSGRLKTKK